MKTAKSIEGEKVDAGPAAPTQAFCPACGGVLSLRSRKTMGNGKKTYFWRHGSNRNRYCTARHHPVN
jgi:hypothetical protein